MKKLLILVFIILSGFAFVSCENKAETVDNVVIRFSPEDTADVDALFDFYIRNGILFPAMLKCSELHTADEPHTYDCLNDGCEMAHDYLIDSTAPYFFLELNCMSGTCGNDIYFLEKKDSTFVILFNECGTIDQDLGPDTLINGFRVIYFEKGSKNFRIIFDGKDFVTEELSASPLTAATF